MAIKRKKRTEVQKLQDELTKISHDHVRKRDSINSHEIAGRCIDCREFASGKYFQAGHFEPSSTCGAILRYHPHNMHGQAAGCNMKFVQERVKINYAYKMIDKYGKDYVDALRRKKQVQIKADKIFYETMISLYKEGDEKKIIAYLDDLEEKYKRKI